MQNTKILKHGYMEGSRKYKLKGLFNYIFFSK